MRILSLTSVVLIIGLLSCRKDKLVEERSILEGKWEWVYSVRTKDFYNGAPDQVDTITQESSSSTYVMEFSNKGILYLIENDEVQESFRIVFDFFESEGFICPENTLGTERFTYSIFGDNDEENNRFQGCVNSDSLISYSKNFPFECYTGATSITYKDFFKKVN